VQEHPDLSKADKKRLCRLIDCRKLSPEVRAQEISNDRMPLRTIVQLLFVEQERTTGAGGSHGVTPPAVDVVSNLMAIDREEEEPTATDQKTDLHRPRCDVRVERAQGEAAAMTRSLSASTKTPARNDRTAEERGSRMRNK
jgi:hypothetical protein